MKKVVIPVLLLFFSSNLFFAYAKKCYTGLDPTKIGDLYVSGIGEHGCANDEYCVASRTSSSWTMQGVVGICTTDPGQYKIPDPNNCGDPYQPCCTTIPSCRLTTNEAGDEFVRSKCDNGVCIPVKDDTNGPCVFVNECGGAAITCPQGSRCMEGVSFANNETVTYTYCQADDACFINDVDQCGLEGKMCCWGNVCKQSDLICDQSTHQCAKGLFKTLGNPVYEGPYTDLGSMLSGASSLLYPAAILVGIGFLIIAGYKYMTSEGDPQKAKEAQADLTAVITGILFVLLSSTFMRIIVNEILGGSL